MNKLYVYNVYNIALIYKIYFKGEKNINE
jgi:hypothetical protein